MTAVNRLGIWMDHANAYAIELTSDMKTRHIESKFTQGERQDSLTRSEHIMHNKEQSLQMEFYKELAEIIKGHQEVLLFGPTDAKKELHNYLTADPHFAGIKIDVLTTDKMTDHERKTFVKEHFSVD